MLNVIHVGPVKTYTYWQLKLAWFRLFQTCLDIDPVAGSFGVVIDFTFDNQPDGLYVGFGMTLHLGVCVVEMWIGSLDSESKFKLGME